MSVPRCSSCGREGREEAKSKEECEELQKEANEHLNHLTSIVFPNHFGLKEEVHKSLQDSFTHNKKYVLFNKIAFFSLKSTEKRRDIMNTMEKIEKKKIKVMEKSIILSAKKTKLKQLQDKQSGLERVLITQRKVRESFGIINEALLLPHIDYCRLRLVCSIFSQFPLSCDTDPKKEEHRRTKSSHHARHRDTVGVSGVSTILGIPLPNSGDFSFMSPHIVCSALSHISLLLSSLAKALNIPLPHPLLPMDTFDFAIIKPHGELTRRIPLTPAFQQPPDLNSSLSGIHSSSAPSSSSPRHDEVYQNTLLVPFSVVQESRQSSLPWEHSLPYDSSAKGNSRRRNSSTKVASDLGFKDVKDFLEERIAYGQLHASGVGWTSNPDFSSGLVLLQANVVHLCLAVGMQASALWPPQALMLNLYMLYDYCVGKASEHLTEPAEKQNPFKESGHDVQHLAKSLQHYCDIVDGNANKRGTSASMPIPMSSGLSTYRGNVLNSVRRSFEGFHPRSVGGVGRPIPQSTPEAVEISTENNEEDDDIVQITYDYVEPDESLYPSVNEIKYDFEETDDEVDDEWTNM